jgi:hypothetical protein
MEATFKKLITILHPYTHQRLSNHSTLSTIKSGATVPFTTTVYKYSSCLCKLTVKNKLNLLSLLKGFRDAAEDGRLSSSAQGSNATNKVSSFTYISF